MRRNRRSGSAARSNVVPLHVSRNPEESICTTTDHYLGIDVHKSDAYVAVMDEEGELVKEVRVANADLAELAQKYEGSEAALEAGSNTSPSTTS
jgi:hypothetical protein